MIQAIHSERQVIFSDFPNTPLPSLLALRVGDLFVRNPRGVPACLYKSSTPTYMSSIPLFSDLLWFFEEHVLSLPRSSFLRYYASLR